MISLVFFISQGFLERYYKKSFTMHGKVFLVNKVNRLTQKDAQAYCESLPDGNAGSQKLFEPQSKQELDDVIAKTREIVGFGNGIWIGLGISNGPMSPNHVQYQSDQNPVPILPVPFIHELGSNKSINISSYLPIFQTAP